MIETIVQVIVSGLLGGAVAGITAIATVRVKLEWLRRDVDWLLENAEIKK